MCFLTMCLIKRIAKKRKKKRKKKDRIEIKSLSYLFNKKQNDEKVGII